MADKTMDIRKRAAEINRALKRMYPEAKCSLDFATPYQLLVATILSAQCTDVRVNMVTPDFFRRFPDAKALSRATLEEIGEAIRSTGFYNNKAKSLLGMAKALVQDHGGQVPRTMEELTPLPGVGRKTANVVLGNSFDVPGIVVDTHVLRVSQRLGLTKHKDPEKIEQDLMLLIPRADWTMFSHRLVYHGRALCQARKPACDDCALARVCAFWAKESRGGRR